ncbi:MAG: 50S ribosomal protein L25 [bacterium]|nr:50S ribosomal protein L25 [bacterium]
MDLNVTTRTILGKKVAALRTKGLVPAELFGRGIENRHLAVAARDAAAAYKTAGEHTVVTLVVDGAERIPAVFADIQQDYRAGTVRAIDFHYVRMDEKIQANVPIRLVGEAPAKKEGFPILLVLSEIELEALPDRMPHELIVSVETLAQPGQTIYVRDLIVSAEVKVRANEDTAIVTVGEKAKEEVTAPPPAGGPVAAPAAGAVAANTATEPATQA